MILALSRSPCAINLKFTPEIVLPQKNLRMPMDIATFHSDKDTENLCHLFADCQNLFKSSVSDPSADYRNSEKLIAYAGLEMDQFVKCIGIIVLSQYHINLSELIRFLSFNG